MALEIDELIERVYRQVRKQEISEDPIRKMELPDQCPPNMRMILRMAAELDRFSTTSGAPHGGDDDP